ncbi:Per1-like protein [Meredithblackwellia eburnea MCA 4105]
MRSIKCAILATITLASFAQASQGDRSPAFQRCLTSCQARCPTTALPLWHPGAWSPWPCSANCAYECTTTLTDLALLFRPVDHDSFITQVHDLELSEVEFYQLTGPGGALEGLQVGTMVQFYGKWPFRAYLGMQEIMSVLFSLANLWAHAKGWKELSAIRPLTPEARNLRTFYRINALVGINTWVWSAVFHTRDTAWTEKADYFSAAASTLFGLWLAITRSFGLYREAKSKRSIRMLTQLVFFSIMISHCAYLSRGRFDYGYNMKFNVIVGVSQILLWTTWGVGNYFVGRTPGPPRSPMYETRQNGTPHPAPPTPSFTTQPSAASSTPTVVRSRHFLDPLQPGWLLLTLTALELLDFAPIPSKWRLLDAHALWHASTIGVVRMWYKFLKEDVRFVDDGRERPGHVNGVPTHVKRSS